MSSICSLRVTATLPRFHLSVLYIIHSHHTSFNLPTLFTSSQLIYKTIMCWLQSNHPLLPHSFSLSLLQKTVFGKHSDASTLNRGRRALQKGKRAHAQTAAISLSLLLLLFWWVSCGNVRGVFYSMALVCNACVNDRYVQHEYLDTECSLSCLPPCPSLSHLLPTFSPSLSELSKPKATLPS